MAIKLKHSNEFHTYFITFTCANWIPLFDITNSYDLVYNWFTVLKKKYNADVMAYVIMPNHLHLILHFHKEGFNLNSIISNGKRFMAYEIINRLKSAGNTTMLENLGSLITAREKKKGQFDLYHLDNQNIFWQTVGYLLFSERSTYQIP